MAFESHANCCHYSLAFSADSQVWGCGFSSPKSGTIALDRWIYQNDIKDAIMISSNELKSESEIVDIERHFSCIELIFPNRWGIIDSRKSVQYTKNIARNSEFVGEPEHLFMIFLCSRFKRDWANLISIEAYIFDSAVLSLPLRSPTNFHLVKSDACLDRFSSIRNGFVFFFATQKVDDDDSWYPPKSKTHCNIQFNRISIPFQSIKNSLLSQVATHYMKPMERLWCFSEMWWFLSGLPVCLLAFVLDSNERYNALNTRHMCCSWATASSA